MFSAVVRLLAAVALIATCVIAQEELRKAPTCPKNYQGSDLKGRKATCSGHCKRMKMKMTKKGYCVRTKCIPKSGKKVDYIGYSIVGAHDDCGHAPCQGYKEAVGNKMCFKPEEIYPDCSGEEKKICMWAQDGSMMGSQPLVAPKGCYKKNSHQCSMCKFVAKAPSAGVPCKCDHPLAVSSVGKCMHGTCDCKPCTAKRDLTLVVMVDASEHLSRDEFKLHMDIAAKLISTLPPAAKFQLYVGDAEYDQDSTEVEDGIYYQNFTGDHDDSEWDIEDQLKKTFSFDEDQGDVLIVGIGKYISDESNICQIGHNHCIQGMCEMNANGNGSEDDFKAPTYIITSAHEGALTNGDGNDNLEDSACLGKNIIYNIKSVSDDWASKFQDKLGGTC